MSDQSTNQSDQSAPIPQDHQPPRRRRRLGSFEDAGREHGVSPRTIRNYAARHFFDLYRVPGTAGVLVDLDEVDDALRRIPARKAKAGFGSYGGARIVTLQAKARAEVVDRGDL